MKVKTAVKAGQNNGIGAISVGNYNTVAGNVGVFVSGNDNNA